MNSKLLQDGLDMTLYGMGAVMAFLLVLVLITVIMSALTRRFFPDPETPELSERGLTTAAAQTPDQRVLRVIKTAIARHRGDKNQ